MLRLSEKAGADEDVKVDYVVLLLFTSLVSFILHSLHVLDFYLSGESGLFLWVHDDAIASIHLQPSFKKSVKELASKNCFPDFCRAAYNERFQKFVSWDAFQKILQQRRTFDKVEKIFK